MVLVPKREGSRRFCLEDIRISVSSYKNHYSVSKMDVYIGSQCGSTEFTTLKTKSGFWQTILHGCIWISCLVYIRGMAIFLQSVEEHLIHVNEVVSTWDHARIPLKWNCSKYFYGTILYIGHTDKSGKLKIGGTMIKSLKEALPPTVTKLRSLLGVASFYQHLNWMHCQKTSS